MGTVHDAVAYILRERGRTPCVMLHKLLYYSQAWSLVWDDRPLFKDRIEAWANGPVVVSVYQCHRGRYIVEKWTRGDATRLDTPAVDTINSVLKFYGQSSSADLISLTHKEDPWKNARGSLLPGQRGNSVITQAAMAEYYGSLVP